MLEGDGSIDNNLVINGEALRNGLHFALKNYIELFRLGLVDFSGFREHEKRKGKIDETILVYFDVGQSLDKLVDFSSDATSDHSSGSSDSGDNFTSNHFGLHLVAFTNFVVSSSEVRGGMDKVDVVVGVIILFKFMSLDFTGSESNFGYLQLV